MKSGVARWCCIPTIEERRKKGFPALYYRVGHFAITHRWKVLAGSTAVLALGGYLMSQLKTQYLPKDLAYLSYVDVWLPEDAPLVSTVEAAGRAEEVIREVAAEYTMEHHPESAETQSVLKSLTTFVGGGGPSFASTSSRRSPTSAFVITSQSAIRCRLEKRSWGSKSAACHHAGTNGNGMLVRM